MQKLTEEQVKQRYLFIGECVDNNSVVPNASKFGTNQQLTVQDLCASNVATLRKIGVSLEKVQKESGESRFVKTNDPVVGKQPVSKWLDFIELTIQNKEWLESQEKNAERRKQIETQLASLETNDEKRKRLAEELATIS